jgi:hypothetical protein
MVPQEDFFKRYAVNVIVRREPGSGAPVIEEQNPTYAALIGMSPARSTSASW